MEINTVLNKDCFEFMKEIKNETIDLIIADVPYNIGKDYGNNSDKKSEEQYLNDLKIWIKEFSRILKKNGQLFIYTGKEFYPYYFIEIKQYFIIKNSIIWRYDSSSVQTKTKYGSLYEPIIWAVKNSKEYTFNKEFAMVEAKTGSKRKLINYRKNPPQPYNEKKIDGDVWYYPRVRYKMKEYTKHPTQKPLSICNRIIKVHSKENDLVYIPFCGSGSEVESCILNGRNWIATELNNEFITSIILPRINKCKQLKI